MFSRIMINSTETFFNPSIDLPEADVPPKQYRTINILLDALLGSYIFH